MGRFAIVENGTVTNVIEADAGFAASIGAVAAETASIGDLYANGQFAAPAPAQDWPALIAAYTLDNNRAYESAIARLTSDYPAAEIQTWERQRAEVGAWDEDKSARTPWIDNAAAARGLDRNEYLARTLEKVNAFATASAFLTGRRQGIDDQIKATTTVGELNAVVINYTLPGASVW